MEEQRYRVVHLEMKFSTAFIIGLGIALAALAVTIIPWIIMVVWVLPFTMAYG